MTIPRQVAYSFVCATFSVLTAVACNVVPAEEKSRSDQASIVFGNPDGAWEGSACAVGRDCWSGVCTGGICQAPTHNDKVVNGDETGEDCGGPTAPKCTNGQKCWGAADCASGSCMYCMNNDCNTGTCTVKCRADETGQLNQCPAGAGCWSNSDCANNQCVNQVCAGAAPPPPPPPGDPPPPPPPVNNCPGGKCAVGQACATHSDCASDGCGDDGKCASHRSCTRKQGGRSCGANETSSGLAQEDCCTTITFGNNIKVDKYDITAGRMRAFVERTNGNLRAAMAGVAGWPAAWSNFLPASEDEVNWRLGGWEVYEESPRINGQRMVDGCYIGGGGARTWWRPAAYGDPTKFTADQLDEKALNCVSFYMAAALCAWDGGRLPRSTELQAAWRGNDNRAYPWGNTMDPSKMVHKFNYWSGPMCPGGNCDNAFYIAAPGRRPAGNGPFGHSDLAGNLFNFVWDGDYVGKWVWTGSFEGHEPTVGLQVADLRARPRYWAAGARCAY